MPTPCRLFSLFDATVHVGARAAVDWSDAVATNLETFAASALRRVTGSPRCARRWCAVAGRPARAQQTPTEFRVIPLSAGIHVIRAEVALEPAER